MIGASASRAAALGTATAELRAAGIDAPRRDARLLMQHALGLSPEALLADDRLPLGKDEAGRLTVLLHRRAAREPIAYLTGRREFWSLEFAVDRSALVPRPESETLVEAVLDRAPRLPAHPRLLDLGTGTGCLLLALLSELPGAVGLGIDVSASAVSLARANARRHGLGERASFAVADWAQRSRSLRCGGNPLRERRVFCRLARRSPATSRGRRRRGQRVECRRLAPQIARLLASGGLAAIELGAGMADEVRSLFAASGLLQIGRRRDLSRIERCALFSRSTDVGIRSQGGDFLPAEHAGLQKRGCKLRDDG